jgi:flagellar biosynthesis protein FlhG
MPQIWPIGGGKGGTGKSFVTGSLGILLAREGYQTLLIDLDLGAANLHTTIGAPDPEKSLSDFVNKKVASLDETIVPTPTPNLFLISGAMNNLDIANLAHEQKLKIMRDIAKLPYEYILLDLGAGTSFNTIDFFMISNSGIFITTPEPTATENIYRLIRSVYFRKIRQVLNVHHFRALEKEFNALEFNLIMNQHRKQDNPNIGQFICKIIEKHLALKIQFFGNVAFDDHVHHAVCNRRPFLETSPYTRTALDLGECFKKLLLLKDKSSETRYAADQALSGEILI